MASRRTTALVSAFLLVGFPSVAKAEQGVSNDRIVFGQAAPLEGPAAQLGLDMQAGSRAAFEEANKAGGVKGRKLDLVSMDDGYEPNKSIEATKKLLDEHKVFALIGPVGTPTSTSRARSVNPPL